MAQNLFDSVNSLYKQLNDSNLDIHSVQRELEKLVELGRQNPKLRIIMQLLAVLEALARNFEYDDADSIANIKKIIKEALQLIIGMVEGGIPHMEGVKKIDSLLNSSKKLLIAKLGSDDFLYDRGLLVQLSSDITKDCKAVRELFSANIPAHSIKQYSDTLTYYLQKLRESAGFLDIKPIDGLISSMLNASEYQNFNELSQNQDFLDSLKYLDDFAAAIQHTNKQNIIDYLNEHSSLKLQQNMANPPFEYKEHKESTEQKKQHIEQKAVTLSEEEISALMDDGDYSVSFDEDLNQKAAETDKNLDAKVRIKPDEYLALVKKSIKEEPSALYDSDLIRCLGRLFQKQDMLISNLPEEKKVSLTDDIDEIHVITDTIRRSVFDKYYISVEKLFGKELQEYIHTEVKSLGKKIRLGIRGERSEMLSKDADFVKELVFTLVKNSLHYSLEPLFRRRATEKSEVAWLLIEFEDFGDTFNIYIRDDGRGLMPDQMHISSIETSVMDRGGSLVRIGWLPAWDFPPSL